MHHMQAVLCAVFGIAAFLPATNVSAETALDRINATNTIRCGYIEYEPALYKDLKTRERRGFDYDIMRVVGERLQVKIDYATSTDWGTVVPDLNTKKFDVLCNGFWVHPNVGKYALCSRVPYSTNLFSSLHERTTNDLTAIPI